MREICYRLHVCARRTLAVLAIVAAPQVAAAAESAMGPEDARHLLTRAGFSPDATELARVAALGREAAVRDLIDQAIAAAAVPVPAPAWYPEPQVTPVAARQLSAEEKRRHRRQARQRTDGLREDWIGRMLVTETPLLERMTLLWHGHFTTEAGKVRQPHLVFDQHQLLRRHALGDFRALLHGIVRDPAMLLYLDNVRNRKQAPVENFARELLELFTLGEGHYTEEDVREVSRAFTGWTVVPATLQHTVAGRQHDRGVKRVLGDRGRHDGGDVVEILLQQPRLAEFIAARLWQEFVSPVPDPVELNRLAAAFARDYDIAELLAGVLLGDAFWAARNRASLIKSPTELVVGTLRLGGAARAESADRARAARAMRGMGQTLFDPPNVAGWPGGTAWITAGSLLVREQFTARLANSATRANPAVGSAAPDKARVQAWLLPVAAARDYTADTTRDYALALIGDPVYQLK